MLDACKGTVLKNEKGQGFSILSAQESGININGVVRDIELIREKDKTRLLFMVHGQKPRVYE